MADKERDFSFEIEEHIGVIGVNKSTGWKKELNKVTWNGTAAKFDIREWDEEHKLMTRGITFHKDEMMELKGLLESVEIA